MNIESYLDINLRVERQLMSPMNESMNNVIPDLGQIIWNVFFVLQNALKVVFGDVFVQSVAIKEFANRFLLCRRVSVGANKVRDSFRIISSSQIGIFGCSLKSSRNTKQISEIPKKCTRNSLSNC